MILVEYRFLQFCILAFSAFLAVQIVRREV